jgi:hypothetical protein
MALTLLEFNCKKNPITPPDDNGVDTTSNNYTWQTFILGDGNASVLNDVSIVNDTLAYAVGDIYIKDSTGQDYQQPYNIAKWDGKTWTLKRVPFNLYGYNCAIGGQYYGGAIAIFPFNNNYALTDGASVISWNENNHSYFPCEWTLLDGEIQKLWCTSRGNIYAVGLKGTFLYYNYLNSSWQKIDLSTTANLFDVWGTTDSKTGESTVYVPASDLNNDNGIKKIFKITGTQVDSISWDTGKNVLSVWGTPDGKTLYAAGDGLFVNKGSGWEEINILAGERLWQVKGDANNNIFARGFPPYLMHYNGASWKEYPEIATFIYRGMDVKGKLVIIVGENGNQAVAVVGIRQ